MLIYGYLLVLTSGVITCCNVRGLLKLSGCKLSVNWILSMMLITFVEFLSWVFYFATFSSLKQPVITKRDLKYDQQ